MPIKIVWETRVQYKIDRGRPKDDWDSMIPRVMFFLFKLLLQSTQ